MMRSVLQSVVTREWFGVVLVLLSAITPAGAYECFFDGPCGYVFTTEQDVTFGVEGKEEVGAIRVVNFDGKTVETIPVTERGKRLPVNLGKLPSGIYWITEVDGRVLYSFAVIPPAGRTVKSEDSPFGVHYACVDREVDRAAKRLDALNQAGVGWIRCSTEVHLKRENPDVYDWSAKSQFVDLVKERKMSMLSFFEQCDYGNPWPSRDKGEIAYWNYPRTLQSIENYVTHFKGKLKYFEVWNEPQNLNEWIAFTKQFHETVKKANPDAVVVQSGLACCAYVGQWGCKFMAQDMQKKTLEAKAANVTDVFNFHFYPYQWKTDDIVPQFMAIYEQFKQTKPVWVTENGISAAPKDMFQQKQQAEYLVRGATTCFHLGIDKYFWFLAWDHPEFKYGLLEENLEPKAAYVAYAVLTKLLDGVELGSSVKANLENVAGTIFNVPKGKVAVLWAVEDSLAVDPRTIIPDQPRVQVHDVMGRAIPINDQGKITLQPRSPVYVVTK
ncbi:MAG: hypothetical protein JXA11_04935 [Phycisphaerae bacterium]|nr:hypothetical protein [Phycisphaerae bacterium]